MKMINTSVVENIIENKFLSSQKFSLDIENYVVDNKCSYIDAILSYCDENEIEIDTISKILSKPLKEKLKNEAERLNFLKKTTKTKKVV
jgi:hypothetical protein